jgi:hypothetical protein
MKRNISELLKAFSSFHLQRCLTELCSSLFHHILKTVLETFYKKGEKIRGPYKNFHKNVPIIPHTLENYTNNFRQHVCRIPIRHFFS